MAENGRVELSLQSQTRGPSLPWQGHRWQTSMHMDGCHFFMSSYRCEDCGASLTTRSERDLSGDPWSMIWMTDDGGKEQCDRCLELLDGAEPASSMIYLGGSRVAV